MFHIYQNYKDMNLEELENALSSIEKSIEKWKEKIKIAQADPRYEKKFKNQPRPNVNSALLELKTNIETEIKEKQNG